MVIFTIDVDGTPLNCQFDEKQHPLVVHGAHKYSSLHNIVKGIPSLQHPDNLVALAKIVNFMLKGTACTYIDDIRKFQEDYQTLVEYEQNTLEYLPVRITDHGVFDVRVMHSPAVVKHELVFYVEDANTHIPYLVHCPFPFETETVPARYSLLPYV